MTIKHLNELLEQVDQTKTREAVFEFAHALLEWMGLRPTESGRPALLTTQTKKLSDFLVHAPKTVQSQLYRLTADGQNIRVRMAVLKKLKKEYISQLVDNDPGLTSYQAASRGIVNLPGREPFIPSQPYFIHFVTTADYDKLVLIFNQGDQKRVLTFRKRLSQTQHTKTLEKWHQVAAKSKPEIAELLWKSLDIKEVNKEFYQKIKEQFDALVGIAKVQRPEAEKEEVKQFAVRLIGRYIFCWFLKEKGIIPSALLVSDTVKKYEANFYQVYLRHLFFNTLNEEVQSRTQPANGTEIDSFYYNIPYLNGGLFDWHPEDKFFDLLDLNDWLNVFVKVLEAFDFTVDESSSLYQQVAIDPEMLGRIFENLLASQNEQTEKLANDRKAFGAFYTPREIVDYMVNESLKAYLEEALLPKDTETNMALEPAVAYGGPLFQNIPEPQKTTQTEGKTSEMDPKTEELKKAINLLFAPDCVLNPFDKVQSVLVRDALSEVKVLDPACGSGAFPMGVLLRLMELRQIVGHGHRNNYDLKGEILSRNIYGVDIMPMAVEIARLRAWLSLVLEADYKPADRKNNFGIAALPNLDFKFVCANSLVDIPEEEFVSNQSAPELENFKSLTSRYFNTAHEDKQRLKAEIQASISKLIGVHTKAVADFEERLKKGKSDLTVSQKKQRKDRLEEHKKQADLWESFENIFTNKTVGFFAPKYFFPSVSEGFDVVIGNPPYGVSVKGDYRVEAVKNLGKVPDFEIYYFFIRAARKFLSDRGIMSYIIPNTILFNVFAEQFRLELLNQWKMNLVLDCTPFKIFEGATVLNSIFLIQKSNQPTASLSFKNTEGVSSFHNLIDRETEKISYSQILSFQKNWGLAFKLSFQRSQLITKLNTSGQSLESIFPEITQGLIAYDKYQGQDENTIKNRDYHSFEYKPGWKRWLWGEDIMPYSVSWNGKEYINYGSGIANPRKPKFFTEKRILVREITNPKIFAAITSEEYYNDPSIINVLEKNEFGLSLEYLCGILNSKLITFYHFNSSPKATKGAFPKILVEDIKNFPIVIGSVKPIERLANQILSAKKSNAKADTSKEEKEIDQLVYQLYGLTEEEVKVVEGKK